MKSVGQALKKMRRQPNKKRRAEISMEVSVQKRPFQYRNVRCVNTQEAVGAESRWQDFASSSPVVKTAQLNKMTSLEATFEKAVALASAKDEGGAWSLSSAEQSTLYGCFKHVKQGPCQGDRPGMFSPVARQKYDAWNKLKDTTKEDAMQQYVDIVRKHVTDPAKLE